jgi:hypothetical protein
VTAAGLTYAALGLGGFAGAILLDALVRPRPVKALRRGVGLWLLACMTAALFGLFVTICGNAAVALALTLALQTLLAVASNAKYAMLGEPLVFADLALLGAIFRHPQFYLSAVAIWQRVVAGLAAAVLLGVLAWLSSPDPIAHLEGLPILALGLGALALSLRGDAATRLAARPEVEADLHRLGLYPTLLLYWLRWRDSRDPPACPHAPNQAPCQALAGAPELLIIVQCESFADPVELFGDPQLALPGLAAARRGAWQWGNLEVSGFGAYTMRTEYGVLFGREEDALGFRRYNPFLTALDEASYALPARLGKGWRSTFVHPHDMRFYGRDQIMPAGGFAELVGEDRFAPPAPGEGRYVTDAAIADEIVALAATAQGPAMVYAVTIENHGPWASDGTPGGADLVPGYLRLVRKGDAMLTDLTQRLGALGKPAMLVFFGDHRPSIPGAAMPGGDRHTPYMMVRLDAAGRIMPGDNRRFDLTPAALHHAMLGVVQGKA